VGAPEVDGVRDLVGGGVDDVYGVGGHVDDVEVPAVAGESETVDVDLSVIHRAQNVRVGVHARFT
jgi:hypothetical protein